MLLDLLVLATAVSAGNILVLNHNHGHSHVKFLGTLADMFAKDGHNVTILSPIMDPSVVPHGTDNPNITKIAHRSPYFKNLADDLEMKTPSFWDLPERNGMTIDWSDLNAFGASFLIVYRGLLEDKQLIASLQATKFDLAVTETFEYGGAALFEILGIRTILAAGSLGVISQHYQISGLPHMLTFVPGYLTTYGDDMTFSERLSNYWIEWQHLRLDQSDNDKYTALFREFYPDLPDVHEIAYKKLGFVLVNSNEFTETPRPSSNMFQYIGGIHVQDPQPLDREIETMLAERPSAVLFSLGSYIQTCHMPQKLKLEILEALATFPDVTFLWKYEKCEDDTTPFAKYPNVVPRPWWPQSDLLADDRVKAFITHGGMNSLLEVSYRGKPTIVVPLFGDQFVNGRAVVRNGMGVMIRRTELSKKTIVDALMKVLYPKSELAKKAKMAAKVLQGKREEYRKETLRWARLLIEFGPMPHLRLATHKLHYFQVMGYDILALVVGVPVAVFVLTVSLICCCCCKSTGAQKTKRE